MSKRTRGTTREANRRRENHARKTNPKRHNFLRHGKRLLWGVTASITRWGEGVPPGTVLFGVPSVDFVPGKGLTFTFPGRIENYIRMEFVIGPAPELNVERARFLSVLQARQEQPTGRDVVLNIDGQEILAVKSSTLDWHVP